MKVSRTTPPATQGGEEAALGIAVIEAESAAREALLGAGVVMSDIVAALHRLAYPLALTATVRT